ncbi:hypothetical protein [Dinghuibacter silviterrae]|uniref:Uncharacterized protein n=1 Tax=Dinghuibacter silviterrae TaxID=1539049 RepID=A0A4R8DW78_9BACT|nr:hypothetical protein [Dinghuibacter silviterrae]TDX01471.1 hypothetical protein EDB95_2507 [Dinghuibacter silviterrae]
MKKRAPFLGICAILMISVGTYLSCRKVESRATTESSQISEARAFFEQFIGPKHNPDTTVDASHIRMTLHKTPLWNKSYVDDLPFGKTITVPLQIKEPVYYKNGRTSISISELSFLIMYKDQQGNYQAEVVTKTPTDTFLHSNPTTRIFSGQVRVEDWAGNLHSVYQYAPNGLITPMTPANSTNLTGTLSTLSAGSIQKDNVPVTPLGNCTETDWYECWAYGEGPFQCESWYQEIDCSGDGGGTSAGSSIPAVAYQYVAAPGGGTTAAQTYQNVVNNFIAISPSIPITNFQSYTQCFDNSGVSYYVTLWCDQPIPGTSASYSLWGAAGSGSSGQTVNVGHTFLSFDEYGGVNGEQITRYMGYYPSGFAWPGSPIKPGTLGDDEQHSTKVALQFHVTQTQFYQILNYMGNAYNTTYNLSSNNCTTYALNGLQAGGINITTQQGTWPGGGGYDPGDLGATMLGPNPYGTNVTGGNVTRFTNMTIAGSNFGSCDY